MKKIYLLLFIIGTSIPVLAQAELNQKAQVKNSQKKENLPPSEVIPPLNLKEEEIKDSFNVDPAELFDNPELYKKEANTEGVFYNRNQFLGGFKTTTFTSTIRFRDAAFVDGDKIRILLNDKVIEAEVSLDGEFQSFQIKLVPGINKIDFEALNEGFASPNTAEFQVYDEKGVIIESSQWNVGTGYKAALILYKE